MASHIPNINNTTTYIHFNHEYIVQYIGNISKS